MQNPICHDKRVYNFGGDTEHPARDFYIDEGCECNTAKKEPCFCRKTVAHLVSSFIPSKKLRRKVRDKILG